MGGPSRLAVGAIAVFLLASISPLAAAQPEPTAGPLAKALVDMQTSIQRVIARAEGIEPPAPTARVVRSGPRSSGAVALTFDDGHNIRACARIADTLRERGAVGTFFIFIITNLSVDTLAVKVANDNTVLVRHIKTDTIELAVEYPYLFCIQFRSLQNQSIRPFRFGESVYGEVNPAIKIK